MRSKQGQIKIAVFGHFGAGNFGNESTLQAMLYNLRRVHPEAQVTCVCTAPERVAADYQVSARPISETVAKAWRWRNPVVRWVRKLLIGVPSEAYRWCKAIKMLSGTDEFIVPGTGLLTDACSPVGWGPYNTFKWSVVAKLCRCKLLFVSVGAGPLYTRRGRFFIKTSLALADYRSYRDESTLRYLQSIGFRTKNEHVAPDLAFSLPDYRLRFNSSEPGRRPVVGLGLMEYAGRYSVAIPTEATYTGYIDSLVRLTEWLLSHGYDVRLLIGDITDTAVIHDFKAALRSRLIALDDDRVLYEVPASVDDLLIQLASTDLVVATRFHNVLLALLLNRPVLSISFHHKCTSLMNQMGLAEYCLDINNLQADELISLFRRLEGNAASLGAVMAEKVQECREALDGQYAVVLRRMWPEEERPTVPVSAVEVRPRHGRHVRS